MNNIHGATIYWNKYKVSISCRGYLKMMCTNIGSIEAHIFENIYRDNFQLIAYYTFLYSLQFNSQFWMHTIIFYNKLQAVQFSSL